MKVLSNESGHWTDEQLIAFFYGAGPEDDHLNGCAECRKRLSALGANRQALERAANGEDDVSFAFLTAQRRRIYTRLAEPVRLWAGFPLRRWASAAATILVLGSGFVMLEQHRQEPGENKISDAQLAQEVSRLSQDLEAQPAAPLQGLFE